MTEERPKKELFEMSTELMCEPSGSDSFRKTIKSTAVVKLSSTEAPTSFERLNLNTDLNEPPSNWLSTRLTNGSHFGFTNSSSGFNSFRIANMFPDCVGEVDVVSDAENIKKLLKIPYSKGPVSMMVHRVENTLLIDSFDIHKHLLMAAESDWKWLRKFFFEHVMSTLSSKNLYQKDYSRDALQQRSLVSKFLYHSLREAAQAENASEGEPSKSSPEQETTPMHWSSLPEPVMDLPDDLGGHEYARNVVWTFEDIQMLLGTDMPIFGGDTHPCISLRLRDMKKPINVLTGIDYWLDNLMCNVPEVVMCYHLDGLVQKYELVKTEDLPHLPGSKFSPKLIHDVAQNILSFLKSNATKAGHTYWLFKGKNDDVVKLYDLTSLCNNDPESSEENPFTVPVAMLLYRVARNLKKQDMKQHGCIKMLLENCISLLDKEKYPQIVTSAHYMLSDLFVPAETNPSSPEFPEEEEVDAEEEEEEGYELKEDGDEQGESVEVGSLCWRNSCTKVQEKAAPPPPLTVNVNERCQSSLKHIADGLSCLRQLDTRQIQKEEEAPKMAHPFTAIPMPYATLTSVAVSPSKTEERQTDTENNWKAQLLTLLYEKALLVTAVMTQNSVTTEQFGAVLRQVQILLVLNLGLQKLAKILGVKHGKEDEMAAMKSFLLGQAGDACCMIVQHWDKVDTYKADINANYEVVDYVLNQMRLDVGPTDDDTLPVDLDLPNMEDVLRSGLECYKQALNSKPAADQVMSLRRRIGNVHNELGVLYMSQASAIAAKSGVQDGEFQKLVKRSLGELEAGISAFEKVADSSNLALLLTNTGRLMRLCSHVLSPANRTPLQGQERNYYVKALNYYQRARYALGSRSEKNEQIWDSVNWELSTTCFNMAVILQDYPDNRNKSIEELEKEVVEHLQKALQACDLTTVGPRQPMYQFRAGSVHHRLASLYHKSLRSTTDDHKKKFTQQLCKMNYEKSAEIFRSLEEVAEFLRVQLERVALAEFMAESSSGMTSKKSFMMNAIDLLLNSEDMVRLLTKQKETSAADAEEELKLTLLMEQRLQCILLSLAKLVGKLKASSAKESQFKAMYAAALHRPDNKKEDLKSVASRLLSVILKVAQLRKDV